MVEVRTPVQVLLLGDITYDVVMPVNLYPALEHEAFATRLDAGVGGSAVNTAIVLSKMGIKSGLLGCLGEDVWGDLISDQLMNVGVGMTGVRRRRVHSTGLIFIVVTPKGERTMFAYRGANLEYSPPDVALDLFDGPSALHLSGYAFMESPQREAAWQAVEFARERDMIISLDTGLDPVVRASNDFKKLLPLLDICVLGREELKVLFEKETPDEAVDSLLGKGVRMVGLKLGSEGCLIANTNEQVRFPAFQVETLDSTGAGDSFSAGMLFASHHGMDLTATGILCSALGALATTTYGGGLGLPGRGETKAFLSELLDQESMQEYKGSLQYVLSKLEVKG
jgi:ribokinase